MQNRLLGNIEVSPIGMGCMGFSHGYGQIPPVEYSIEAIRDAHDFGCTHFDTAEVYGRELYYPGHNEEIVGKAVAPFRRDISIATKIHLGEDPSLRTADIYQVLREHLEASMKHLGTDYVDLYYLHRTNSLVPMGKVADGMGRLIKEGLIRGWGMSAVSAEQISEAHAVTPLSAVQNIYSMLERDSEEDIIPTCIELGIGFVPFSPIASGFLSGKVTTDTSFVGDDVRKFVPQLSKENIEKNQPILQLLEKFAAEKDATKAQISLAWMLHKYPNVVPIPGSKNKQRIIENLSAWNVTLSDDEFQVLDSALDGIEVHGHRGCVESEQASFGKKWLNQKQ